MEWFVDDPKRGQAMLGLIAIVIAVAILWFGRRRLLLAILIALVFLLFAGISIPGAIPARSASQKAACIANLRTIRDAKAEWAKAKNKLPTDFPTASDLYGTNGFLRDEPLCPRGGKYTIGSIRRNPTCSFSDKGHRLD